MKKCHQYHHKTDVAHRGALQRQIYLQMISVYVTHCQVFRVIYTLCYTYSN